MPRPYVRPGADPAVVFLIKQTPGMRRTMEVEVAAGLGDTTRSWRYRSSPSIGCLRRALNAAGYDLAIVDIHTRQVVR
jgi:hypothetical protein